MKSCSWCDIQWEEYIHGTYRRECPVCELKEVLVDNKLLKDEKNELNEEIARLESKLEDLRSCLE